MFAWYEREELCRVHHLSEFCQPLNVTISRLFVETSIKIMTNRGECRQVIVKVDDKYGTNCNDQTRGGLPDGWTDILMAHNMSERQSIKTLLRFCDLMWRPGRTTAGWLAAW